MDIAIYANSTLLIFRMNGYTQAHTKRKKNERKEKKNMETDQLRNVSKYIWNEDENWNEMRVCMFMSMNMEILLFGWWSRWRRRHIYTQLERCAVFELFFIYSIKLNSFRNRTICLFHNFLMHLAATLNTFCIFNAFLLHGLHLESVYCEGNEAFAMETGENDEEMRLKMVK